MNIKKLQKPNQEYSTFNSSVNNMQLISIRCYQFTYYDATKIVWFKQNGQNVLKEKEDGKTGTTRKTQIRLKSEKEYS